MGKLFRYELRRIICNKVYLAFLVILLVYGYSILSGDVIMGVKNTAPFSRCSVQFYFVREVPVITLISIFLIFRLFTQKEKAVQNVIQSLPFGMGKLIGIRFAAMMTAVLGFALISLLEISVFLFWLFQYKKMYEFFISFGVVMIPAILGIYGLGFMIGKVSKRW